MLSLKGKTVTRSNKTIGKTKVKVLSENLRVDGATRDNVGCSSKMPVPVKKGGMMANSSIVKVKENVNDAPESRGNQKALGKTKLGRRPLADISNTRGNCSKPGVTRNSIGIGALTSTASSSRPPIGKVKICTATVVTASHVSAETSSKSMRTSSNFCKLEVNETVQNMARQTSRSNNIITRNSLPVLKERESVLQGDFRSEKRKIVFNVKNRSGGLSNLKGKVLKDRASDGFMRVPPRIQTGKVLQGIRKSVKPHARNSWQTSNAQRNFKSKSVSSLGTSLGASSARRMKVATSAIPKNSKSMVHDKKVGVIQAEGRDNIKPEISDTSTSKRSSRRKSYTSSLISRSKSLRQNDKDEEQEKLPSIDNEGDPLEVAEYVDDIYQYYWVVEAQSTSLENYMMVQTDITPQMRGILVNWLIEVHFKFDLMPETLYLAVALLDRYLSLVPVKKTELQLVGLTSLLLASKYEDFWHPRVKDLISISAESYTRDQILEMEKEILKKLKFRLNLPTAYVFMLRFLKASQSGKRLEHLAFYLIELSLVDYEALRFRPSLLCASAVFLARCCLNKVPAWTPLLGKHSHYDELQIRECSEVILKIHKAASSSLLNVTYDKFKRPEFGGVASIKPLESLK